MTLPDPALMWTDTGKYNQLYQEHQREQAAQDLADKGVELATRAFPDLKPYDSVHLTFEFLAELLANAWIDGKED